MIYEYLWTQPNEGSALIPCNAKGSFASPSIVGEHFAREAYVWLHEHGDLGLQVPILRLKKYLTTDVYGAGVVPADCKLRSLSVCVKTSWDRARNHTHEVIESSFAPLFELALIRNFELTIHINYTFQDGTDLRMLATLCSHVKAVAEKIIVAPMKYKVEFEFKQTFPQRGDVYGVPRPRISSTYHHREHPKFLHMKGHRAQQMLQADFQGWYSLFKRSPGPFLIT
jgi:hypothetical protein